MLHFDPATGMTTAPIWVSATLAAVVVVLAVLAIARNGAFKTLFALLALAVLAYGGLTGFQMMERAGVAERAAERRAFEQRADELISRALLPGSPLGCVDGALNDKVVTGCEQIVFGSADNVAAAVAFVSARLGMLIDGVDLAARSDADYEGVLSNLRRGLELDRFGVVAHVLSRQPNCTPEQCELLSVLQDANRVRMNLQEKPFDALIARYAPTWNQATNETSSIRVPGQGTAAPIPQKYDLPSAASIPPVSIMTAEPTTPANGNAGAPANTTASTAPETTAAPTPRRPPGIRAPVRRRASDAAPPVQLAPAAPAAPSTPAAAR